MGFLDWLRPAQPSLVKRVLGSIPVAQTGNWALTLGTAVATAYAHLKLRQPKETP